MESTSASSPVLEPLEDRILYRYLGVESFSDQELDGIFHRIRQFSPSPALSADDNDNCDNDHANSDDNADTTELTKDAIRGFLIDRIQHFEHENALPSQFDEHETNQQRLNYADQEADRLLQAFYGDYIPTTTTTISKQDFTDILLQKANAVDYRRIFPITTAMLMVGTSVGIIIPVMPFVVESLGLTPGQYGTVVSAFALAKMSGNVPSAILVERHGRKPYLVWSLTIIAIGVGGVGLATSFEHLYISRLLTGLGVAALTSASTMTIADMSTPKNRAQTMAPIMSAFAAGTALGPALGGFLADQVGIQPTFYLVGLSYLGLTAVNHTLLTESKLNPIVYPWQQTVNSSEQGKNARTQQPTIPQAFMEAIEQWIVLMKDSKIRRVVVLNGFYWVALSGAQMTILPLLLTNPEGLAMTATGVGQVYMGMSTVQVLGNPVIAKFVDRAGKAPAMVVGGTLISAGMAALPFCETSPALAAVLGVWATGGTLLSTAPVAYVSDHTEDEHRAQAIALLRTSGDVGFLLGASAVGAMADWTGNLDVAMQTSAGVLLTATTWFGVRKYMMNKSISA